MLNFLLVALSNYSYCVFQLSFNNVISIDEKLVYTPHPEDKHK